MERYSDGRGRCACFLARSCPSSHFVRRYLSPRQSLHIIFVGASVYSRQDQRPADTNTNKSLQHTNSTDYYLDDSSRPETVELKSDGSQRPYSLVHARPRALLVSARLGPEEQVITNSSSVLHCCCSIHRSLARRSGPRRTAIFRRRPCHAIQGTTIRSDVQTWCGAWSSCCGVSPHLIGRLIHQQSLISLSKRSMAAFRE